MPPLSDRIRQLCSRHRIQLNTDLGQHFLIDQEVLDAIVETAHIQPSQTVVEIGAGLGVLTKELLAKAAKVISIELDQRWLRPLQEYVALDGPPQGMLELIHKNALRVPFPTEPYSVVANIPYHITSPLLRHAFLESPLPPTSMTLLIQREVAERICDEENAGILTVIVRLFGTPRFVKHVPPSAFLPPPKVDSAILHIECFPAPLTDTATLDRILRLLKLAFSQKRKMLSNSIGTLPDGKGMLERAGIEATRRPQTLSVAEWIRLAHTT